MADKKAKIEKLATKQKWKAIAAFLTDPNAEIRIAAFNAIGASEDPSYAQAIAFSLNDASAEVRIAAANALGKVATNREVEQMRQKMETEQNADVKAAYLEALREAKGGKREKSVYNASKY